MRGERMDRMDREFLTYSMEDRTIGRILEDKAQRNRDKVFLYHEDLQMTYGQLNERSIMAANAFLDLGL